MLTSSNQYIRPEYLSPLPNNFDSKSSPLALLAKTCSSIGSDQPNPKLLANIEKSTKSGSSTVSAMSSNREKLSPTNSNSTLSNSSAHSETLKSSFKPYESNIVRDHTKSPEDRQIRIKSPKDLTIQHQSVNGRCESNQSASSSSRASPSNTRKTPNASSNNAAESNAASPNCASSKESSSANSSSSLDTLKLTDSIKDLSTNSLTKPTSSITTPSTMSSLAMASSPSPYFYPGTNIPYPMDLMAANPLLSPHHHAMLKAAAMNPYYAYSKMKDSMMSTCRDPYCTGCALSSHMMNKSNPSTCPAGCTQCDHSNSTKSPYATSNSSAMYAQLAALATASQLPYTCSWIASDSAYCGKRFATSDELFQHLRTQHTASVSISEALLNPSSAGIPPTHPLFQRTYPTPPLSPLSTARYHPYSKPSSLLPPTISPLSGLPMPTHPSLAQYFSPYFYGPRLGTSPSMQP
uniref:Putative elbow b n=1 Tax=Corethrella appendiculata TaxID=1370023 RepID=U5EQ13_9DIPT